MKPYRLKMHQEPLRLVEGNFVHIYFQPQIFKLNFLQNFKLDIIIENNFTVTILLNTKGKIQFY